MVSAKVTSKGQVTIPETVRDRLGLEPGDELEFVDDGTEYRIRKEVRGESPFRRYKGYLKHLRGEDTDALIAEMRGR